MQRHRLFPPLIFILLFGLLAACARAPSSYEQVVGAGERPVAQDMGEALQLSGLARADAGFVLIDAQSGEMLQAHAPDRPLIPASTLKLSTAIAALDALGGGFRFHTTLCHLGDDLYLMGGGDPDLGFGDLSRMAAAPALKGWPWKRFITSSRTIKAQGRINPAQPADAYYNAVVDGLTLRDGLRWIHWQPAATPQQAALYGAPQGLDRPDEIPGDWLLSRAQGDKGRARFPLRDPAFFTAGVFRLLAKGEGVDLPVPETGDVPPECRILANHVSRPLSELVDGMLTSSSNLRGELIGLAVAEYLGHRPESLAESAGHLARWWRARLQETNWTGFQPENHSGLGVESRVSAGQLAAMLHSARHATSDARDLRHMLPVSGVKGWLKDRLAEPSTALRVRAKTGTMNYAVGLAGEIQARSGRMLIFAVLVNDLALRRKLDAGEAVSPDAAVWNGKARDAVDALVRGWVSRF